MLCSALCRIKIASAHAASPSTQRLRIKALRRSALRPEANQRDVEFLMTTITKTLLFHPPHASCVRVCQVRYQKNINTACIEIQHGTRRSKYVFHNLFQASCREGKAHLQASEHKVPKTAACSDRREPTAKH
jgi:hypothetical protein